jgi:drug/metabolite transporter (DMT)-like permease
MKNKAVILMSLFCIAGASNVIVLSVILKQMNAYTLLFLRWTITLLLLAPVVFCTEGWKMPGRKNLLLLGGMGILSVVLGNLFAFEAYKTTTAINIGFIGALGPMLIAFLLFYYLVKNIRYIKYLEVFWHFQG